MLFSASILGKVKMISYIIVISYTYTVFIDYACCQCLEEGQNNLPKKDSCYSLFDFIGGS